MFHLGQDEDFKDVGGFVYNRTGGENRCQQTA